MATVTIPHDEPFVRTSVSWAEYIAFSDSLGERHARVTYDRGVMEFMTISSEHDRIKHLFVLILAVLAEELDIAMFGYGSMTNRREDLERGLEPDECYWIAHAAQLQGRTDIDLRSDPPPDLAIEVEISRSALDRMGIYAGLGVPEVWRCDGQTLRVCVLGEDGTYTEAARSRAFPFLPVTGVMHFIHAHGTWNEGRFLRRFREWVREQNAQGWPATPA